MEFKSERAIVNFYERQYRKILAGRLYVGLNPKLGETTRERKYEAIHDIILENTVLLLDVTVAMKGLELGKFHNNNIEMNYYARSIAVNCTRLLLAKGGIISNVMALDRLFDNDLIKPVTILRKIVLNRRAIKRASTANYSYFKKIKTRIDNIKYADALYEYEILKKVQPEYILNMAWFIEHFIELNGLLVLLMKHLDKQALRYA